MEREQLFSLLKNLPVIMGGQIAEDYQIVEENEGDIHFKVTKEIVPIPQGLVVYMMSVSGEEKLERTQFVLKITEILGRPFRYFTIPEQPDITFVCWNADEIDQKIEKIN